MTVETREKFVQMFEPVRLSLINMEAQLRYDPEMDTTEEVEKQLLERPSNTFDYFRDLKVRVFEEDIQNFQEWGDNMFGKAASVSAAMVRYNAVHDAYMAWAEFNAVFRNTNTRHKLVLYQDTKDSLPSALQKS